MERHKLRKVLIIMLYLVIGGGILLIPLWHRALEPYDYIPSWEGEGEVRKSYLWGPYGYAYIVPAFIIFSAIYWGMAAILMASGNPLDKEEIIL